MLTYFILYSTYFAASLYELFSGQVAKRLVIFLSLILVAFVGLRHDSVDYFGYLEIFQKVSLENFSFPLFEGGSTGKEFLFGGLGALLNSLSIPFEVFVLLIATLSVTPKLYLFKKYSPFFFLSVLSYFSYIFFKDLGQMRSGLAAAYIMLSIPFLAKRRFIPFFFCILVASGFHIFSLASIPLLILTRVINFKAFFLSVLSAGVAISLFTGGITEMVIPYIEVFDMSFRWKVQYYYYGGSNVPIPYSLFNLSLLALAYFMTLKIERFTKISEYFPYFLGAYVYGLTMYFTFIDFRILAARFIETTSLLQLAVLLPICIASYSGPKRLFALGLFYIYISLMFYKNLQFANPYQLIFL